MKWKRRHLMRYYNITSHSDKSVKPRKSNLSQESKPDKTCLLELWGCSHNAGCLHLLLPINVYVWVNVSELLWPIRHILSAYLLKLKQYQAKETQRLEAQAYGDVVQCYSDFPVETLPSSNLHSHLLSITMYMSTWVKHSEQMAIHIQANEECVEMYNCILPKKWMNKSTLEIFSRSLWPIRHWN